MRPAPPLPAPPYLVETSFAPAPSDLADRRIVLIDDEPRNVTLLTRALEAAGFTSIWSTSDSSAALDLCCGVGPDIIVLDLHMPAPDGFALLRALEEAFRADPFLPIIVVTADGSERAKRQVLAAGARDFLTKPFSLIEAVLRISNLLETRVLYKRLEERNHELGARVEARTRELEAARLEVLERLTQAVEFRDDVTGRHTRRVGELAAAVATGLGLPEAEVDLIRRAAPLHDVGKIAIPDAILQKPGRLTAAETSVMRRHTELGAKILSGGTTQLMATAETIARSHHERWDGAGYPAGAAADEIPLPARIVALADVFDAVTHPRQYRPAWRPDQAVREIRDGAGRHFDPLLVEAFLDLGLGAEAEPIVASA